MTWDEWEATYKPMRNPNSTDPGFWGCMFETYGDDVDTMKQLGLPNTHFWTMVDGGDIYLDLTSGVHWVDRLGYFVTELPWTEEVYVTNQKETA